MLMFPTRLSSLLAASLMAGCAGPMALPPDPASPASPAAREGPPAPLSSALDRATAAAEMGPSRAVPARPAGQDPTTSMGDMKGMAMPGMGGMSGAGGEKPPGEAHGAMPGMDMPGGQGASGAGTGAAVPPATTQAAADYTCSMHPQIHQDHPGNCPICGMKLIQKTPGANAQKGGTQ